MYIIIWEFEVAPERAAEFRSIYSPRGEWAQLFMKAPGYLGTQLLYSIEFPDRFITIDRWSSQGDFESFRQLWSVQYAALDLRCEGLTASERRIGAFSDLQ